MALSESEWQVEFYTTARGTSPPREFIDGLSKEERAKVYHYLRLLREFGVQLREPHAKPLRGHKPLWELRPGANRLIYFAYSGRRLVVLHAFSERRQRIPLREIATAERRLAGFLEGER